MFVSVLRLWLGELVFGCLEAASARSVLEIGALEGQMTEGLLEWGAGNGARVVSVDPEPTEALRRLQSKYPELQVLAETSLEAIPRAPAFDSVIIDGDHNWFTVKSELEAIADRTEADGSEWPVVLLHDLGWPLARRDSYSAPDRIPEEFRQPFEFDVRLDPDQPGLAEGGLRFSSAAIREGGPRNGTLTAVEDFLSTERAGGLRFALVPAFFGLGVIWPASAPWSGEVERLLAPYDRNPLIARLEDNRLRHLAKRDVQTRMLERISKSGTFRVAESLSKIRNLGKPAVSGDDIDEAVGKASSR